MTMSDAVGMPLDILSYTEEELLTNRVLDLLEKLGVQSACPNSLANAMRRAIVAVSFDVDHLVDLGNLAKRVRST